MWTQEILGTDMYHLVASFVIYSMMGWLVESIYMSFCNKKITNRGFAKGPFCPIYGFGAVFGYLILRPFSGSYILVYIMGAVLATVFEFIVGKVMIKLLGSLWWDYNDKPFNYQGIICLESTIAWGFYAIGVVMFLHNFLQKMIDKLDIRVGTIACGIILFCVLIDYIIQLGKVFHEPLNKTKTRIVAAYRGIRTKR